jgi:type I restriction enzyme S subunit
VAKIEEILPKVEEYGKAQDALNKLNEELPERLKKSILQEAIEGRLVPQDPNDEPASDLLDKIRQEKAQLVKAGKLKKKDLIETPIPEDEIPFDIPDTWKWVRFGSITINRDSERVPLSVDERSKLNKIYDYYGASGVIDKVDKYLFDKPLLLIGEDGANLINRSSPIAFIATGKYWVNNHAHVLDYINEDLMQYMCWYINAISLVDYVTGTAQPKMNQEKMNSILVALPPLAEQHRIVEKLEQLLGEIDKLKK